MKRLRGAACALAFALLCAAVLLPLAQVSRPDNFFIPFAWDEILRAEPGGEPVPVQPEDVTGLRDGESFILRALVKDIPPDGCLLLYPICATTEVYMDGELAISFFAARSDVSSTDAEGPVRVPFAQGAQTCALELRLTVHEGASLNTMQAFFLWFGRVSSEAMEAAFSISSANLYAIPAGACALALLMMLGMFLLGLYRGERRFSLLLPAGAAAVAIMRALCHGSGAFLLPETALRVFLWFDRDWLIPALLLAFLLVSRREGFARMFARVLVWSCVALVLLVAALLLSGTASSLLSRYDTSAVFYLAEVYLALVCAGICFYERQRSILRAQAERHALETHNKLALQGYLALSEQAEKLALMRHEWKNGLLALELLLKQGKYDALGDALSSQLGEMDRSAVRTYTENASVNLLLQYAADRAGKQNVEFSADILLPAQLDVRERDMCTLLMNLFDNAIEAAAAVQPPDERLIRCRMRYKQGFWVVRCSNTYSGERKKAGNGLRLLTKCGVQGDHPPAGVWGSAPKPYAAAFFTSVASARRAQETRLSPKSGVFQRSEAGNGLYHTTKAEKGHGLGLKQISAVTEAYHGALRTESDAKFFTVELMLKA